MLNHAAALFRTNPMARSERPNASSLLIVTLSTLGVFALLSSSASALDGIDLSQPAEPTAAGECSKLVQIKYPFLDCANGEIGLSTANEDWESARQIPIQSDWMEGDGAFGPDFQLD